MGDIVGRGILENTVEQMAIVDSMVPTEGQNTTDINMIIHFKTNNK